jgi:hypothetical protein
MSFPKVDLKTATSVAVGVALFGALVWAIRMLPANAVTTPVKKVADIATTR